MAVTSGAVIAFAYGVALLMDLHPVVPVAVAAGGLVVALAATALAAATARRLQTLRVEAVAVQRSDWEGGHGFAGVHDNAESHGLVVALQRMLRAGRERIRHLLQRNEALCAQIEQRRAQLNTLEDLSYGLAGQSEPSALAVEALSALSRTVGCHSASIWARAEGQPGSPVVLLGGLSDTLSDEELQRLVGQRLSRANVQHYESIERDRRPVVENDSRASVLSWLWTLLFDDPATSALYRGTRSWMALPLLAQHTMVGVLRVDHAEAGWFDEERQRLLGAIASQTALALHHAELLTRERDVAVVAERQRIARELHDAVSQTLFAAHLVAAGLTRRVEPLDASLAEQARQLERLHRAASSEMRLLLLELRPDALEAAPLPDLLLQAADAASARGDLKVHTRLMRGEALPGALRVQLYRIAQEALGNVVKHSRARNVEVDWQWESGGEAVLRIVDDGLGFDLDAPTPGGHFGLANMRERAAAIGARLQWITQPGAGTEVRLTLPLDATGRPAREEPPSAQPSSHKDTAATPAPHSLTPASR